MITKYENKHRVVHCTSTKINYFNYLLQTRDCMVERSLTIANKTQNVKPILIPCIQGTERKRKYSPGIVVRDLIFNLLK